MVVILLWCRVDPDRLVYLSVVLGLEQPPQVVLFCNHLCILWQESSFSYQRFFSLDAKITLVFSKFLDQSQIAVTFDLPKSLFFKSQRVP